jgi:hypothetical protein
MTVSLCEPIHCGWAPTRPSPWGAATRSDGSRSSVQRAARVASVGERRRCVSLPGDRGTTLASASCEHQAAQAYGALRITKDLDLCLECGATATCSCSPALCSNSTALGAANASRHRQRATFTMPESTHHERVTPTAPDHGGQRLATLPMPVRIPPHPRYVPPSTAIPADERAPESARRSHRAQRSATPGFFVFACSSAPHIAPSLAWISPFIVTNVTSGPTTRTVGVGTDLGPLWLPRGLCPPCFANQRCEHRRTRAGTPDWAGVAPRCDLSISGSRVQASDDLRRDTGWMGEKAADVRVTYDHRSEYVC